MNILAVDFPDGQLFVKEEYADHFRRAVERGLTLSYIGSPPKERKYRDILVGRREHRNGNDVYPLAPGIYFYINKQNLQAPSEMKIQIATACMHRSEELRARGIRTPLVVGYYSNRDVCVVSELVGLDTLDSVFSSSSSGRHYKSPQVLDQVERVVDLILEEADLYRDFSSLPEVETSRTTIADEGFTETSQRLIDLRARIRTAQSEHDASLEEKNLTEEDKQRCAESFARELRKASDNGVWFYDLAGRNVVVDSSLDPHFVDMKAVRIEEKLGKRDRRRQLAILRADKPFMEHLEPYMPIIEAVYI